MIKKLNCADGHKSVLEDLELLRSIMGTRIGVYAATDFGQISNALASFKFFNEPEFKRCIKIFFKELAHYCTKEKRIESTVSKKCCRPTFVSDSSVGVQSQSRHVLVGIGSLESSFVLRNVPAIDDVGNEDLAPLMLFYQYLVQLEVSFKIQCKDQLKGFS